jgi:hypothetical protein
MSLEIGQFLDGFFGAGNEISRAQAEASPELSSLIDGLQADLAVPAVLPRRIDKSNVEWFVLCGDEAGLRRTQSELLAFVGPTYGRWDGMRVRLRESDPVESSVNDFCGGRAIRFRTQGTDEFKACWSAIQLMRKVWAQRPEQDPEQIRTGAALLREFELATAAGDTLVSAEALGELRRRGLLGAENIRFLEIRQSAAEGRWADIACSEDLHDLAKIRRPWLITEDILTALYRTRIARAEIAGNAGAAIETVRALAGQFPQLLILRGPLRSRDVVKLSALQLAAVEMPDGDRIRALGDVDGLTVEDRAWITTIADSVRPPTGHVPVHSARDLLADGDVDGAYALASKDDAGVRRAEVLIECAFELQTLVAASMALSALDALDEVERAALQERRLVAIAVAHLRSLAEPSQVGKPPAPRSWTEWFDRLLHDTAWRAAAAVAACGELEYEANDVVDRDAAQDLARAIADAADSDRRHVVRDALPHIIGWLDRQAFDPVVVRPIHAAILTVLALDTAWGDASLEVAYNSAEAVLVAGVDRAAYDELLEQLGLVWERMAARRHVAWLADILELLEMFPGPRDALLGFAATTIGPVRGAVGRASPVVLDALRASLLRIGADDLAASVPPASEPTAEDAVPSLAGQLVGIYTLSPQVALRARQAIESRFPGVRVEVDSSHVSTTSLEHLAAAADYLIVSIRSAKHAATDAIDRCRPRDRPTIIPGGRGSSRMLEALVDALR